MKKVYLFFALFVLWGCSSEDVNNTIIIDITGKVKASFETASIRVFEGETQNFRVNLSRKAEEDGFIELTAETTAINSSDFTINPDLTIENTIDLFYSKGDSTLSFDFTALKDDDTEVEEIVLSISNASDELDISEANSLVIEIRDPATSEDDLTVVTWNIENFPMVGSTTINKVVDAIENMDADVIALQEMDDISAFNTLVNSLDGWEGLLYDVRGGIELAYLYKTEEITEFSNLTVIYNDDNFAFPRQPVLTTIKHINGLEVTLINIHLKCCGVTGSEDANRREAASIDLENYINTNLSNQNVIVLGDWNDDISDGPFDNFLNNAENFVFADFEIGEGDEDNWSYPSWPSHLDHILITNELFDNLIRTETLKLEQEVSSYFTQVSDHRPVASTFSN